MVNVMGMADSFGQMVVCEKAGAAFWLRVNMTDHSVLLRLARKRTNNNERQSSVKNQTVPKIP